LTAGSDAWLLSLGPLVAPAGATLLLATRYTAAVQQRQGLWRSSPYVSHRQAAGQQRQVVLLSTEFEMNTARMVLPCMDLPGLKVRALNGVMASRGCRGAESACCRVLPTGPALALCPLPLLLQATFMVEVLAPGGLTVLSNMPEEADSTALTGNGSRLVSFLPTPPMSTYLLSVVVGELAAVTARTTRCACAVGCHGLPGRRRRLVPAAEACTTCPATLLRRSQQLGRN
jgi:hypothetical protein